MSVLLVILSKVKQTFSATFQGHLTILLLAQDDFSMHFHSTKRQELREVPSLFPPAGHTHKMLHQK